ncbi:unnamed protein product [Schistosoma mattheei]|uniref:Uncharacterized protein n=1 Tax=Schistosoma mattheei TaxID=31246 RepID=A0A183PG44_9TREM|nr:unnamed protein product [Schistosoma mattheei]
MNNEKLRDGIGSWIWYCRQVGEELSGKLILPKPPGYQYNAYYTGCFGDGPGVIDTNNGTLCSIPYLCYNLGFDSSNLTSWFIPESDDLYVTVFIEFGTLSPDMRFKWNIREIHSDGTLLPFDQVQQDTYTEGTFTSSWRIKKGYFINKSNDVKGCIVCATLTKNTDMGTSCLRFKYLPRPTPGICTYTLNDTNMCVNCVNFTSIVSPLTYTFFLTNSSIKIALASENLPKTCFVVPYMYSPLDACVYVSDKFGGSIEVCYANIFTPDAILNRDLRSKVIQMLVNIVNNFIPTDSNSFILAMSCTENILSNILDVDRSSQSKLNTYLTKVTESLEAIVCDNTDHLLTMTSTIFQSALLLADAGNSQINNPISLDIPTDPALLDYNVDLEKAGELV